MFEAIFESVKPTLIEIGTDLVKALPYIVIVIYGLLKTKILSFIKNEMLHRVATEAFSLAEAKYKEMNSKGKFNHAYSYASDKLGRLGIKVSAKEVEAAIEQACLKYNAEKKKVVVDKAS